MTVAVGDPTQPSMMDRLAAAGIDRCSFLRYCAGLVAVLALPAQFTPEVAATLAPEG